jgi:hypothetical protein
MRPSAWFIVGVRLFGVYLLIRALEEAIIFFQVRSDMLTLRQTAPAAYLFHGAVYFVVAGLLLFGAPSLAKLLHWPRRDEEEPPKCPGCGYDLRGGHEKCPECGRAVPPRPQTGPQTVASSHEPEAP